MTRSENPFPDFFFYAWLLPLMVPFSPFAPVEGTESGVFQPPQVVCCWCKGLLPLPSFFLKPAAMGRKHLTKLIFFFPSGLAPPLQLHGLFLGRATEAGLLLPPFLLCALVFV